MKEAAFIPDNISAISNVSRHQIMPNPSHQFTQLQSDSTDNLVEEILRQRAERLKRQAFPPELAASVEKTQFQHSFKEIVQYQNIHNNKSQEKLEPIETKQLNLSKQSFQLAQKLINQSKGTINHSQIKEKESINKIQVQDHLQVLNNQTNQFSQNQIEENGDKDQIENTNNKFSLPNIDKMSNESQENQKKQESQQDEKSLQLNLSLSPSEKKQRDPSFHESQHKQEQKSALEKSKEEISLNKIDKSSLKQDLMKQKYVSSVASLQKLKTVQHQSSNTSNHLMHQQIGNGQSHIEVKDSQYQSVHADNFQQKKDFYEFTPIPKRNQTDFQLVKAITQHLNTIQNQQVSQKTFRKSEKYNVPVIEAKKQPEAEPLFQDLHQQLKFQEFETDYSQNNREVKILEHRWQSNLQFQIDQLKEMIALYEALIMNEQCKQAKKDIKQLELSNRRDKIALRSASYSKRFNFHSPIPKNNDKPLEFRTKFVISPRLKDQYHQTKQNIINQKKKHGEFDEEYQVLCNYYDMMKQKKITVYQQTLKEYEYNSKIQKYETVKNSFYRKPEQSLKETPKKTMSQYEFNKTKRTIQIENSNVPYYQVLKFKIDISKDMILQFQVWNLSKVKKLKDQIILIKKEIKYVDQLISKIDGQFLNNFGIKAVKSLSKSRFQSPKPNGMASTSPVRALIKSPMRPLRRLNTANSSSEKNIFDISSSNGFKLNETPTKPNLVKKESQDANNQLLLINSVQLDYSKRKAMRILDQMDDYGMGPIKEQSKVMEEMPTFGKKQNKRLITSPKNVEKSKSKSKNFVKPRSREIKTMTNLDKSSYSKKKFGKMSEQASPRKEKSAQSQYYVSIDDLSSKNK